MSAIIAWITAHLGLFSTILGFVYEFLVRIKPTGKDWSIINFLKKIIDWIPNNDSKTGGTH